MNFAGVQSVTIPEGDVKSIVIGGVTVWQKPNPLPYDAEVEYVESSRTQYINTGVPTVTPFVVEIKFSINANGQTNDTLFGTFLSNNRLWLLLSKLSNSKNRIIIRCTNPQISGEKNVVDLLDNKIATIRARFGSGGWFEVNGGSRQTYTSAEISLPNNNLYLLGRNGNNFPIGARIYSATISNDNGVLVRSFVPVRVGTAGYLYDRANPTGGPLGNGLYGSETSTPLVAGPDKNGA